MKKFIVFFLLCSFLFTASLFKKEFDFSSYKNLQVQVFTSSASGVNFDDAVYTKNGDGQIISCNYEVYKKITKTLNNISGVTFIFSGNREVFNEVVKKLKVKTIEGSATDFVGYSNFFDSSVSYDGKKVNVQGYYNNGKIYIGTPLLLGSY